MPEMATLTLAEVRSMVLEELNLSKDVAYGTFDNSPLYKNEFINDIIFNADDKIVNLIVATPGHPRRLHYTTGFNLINPGIQQFLNAGNDHRGVVAIEIVRHDGRIVAGQTAPTSKINEWLANKPLYGDDDCIDGYYDLSDSVIVFTGTSCNVTVLSPPKHNSADANLFAPPEYKTTIVSLATAELMMKDPAKRDMASGYYDMAAKDMDLIMAGSEFVPSVTEYKKAR